MTPATKRHLVRSSTAPPATARSTPHLVERRAGNASHTAASRMQDRSNTDPVSGWPCAQVTAAATARPSTPTPRRRRWLSREREERRFMFNKVAACGYGVFPKLLSVMPIDVDVAHVANLARLALSPEKLDRYRQELGVILEHASRVQEVDTSGIMPLSHPLGSSNVFRPDELGASLDREEVLEMAPRSRDGFFVTPPALD